MTQQFPEENSAHRGKEAAEPAPDSSSQERNAAWYFRMLFFLAIGGTALAGIVGGSFYWYFARGLPNIITVEDYRPLVVTNIVASSGPKPTVIGEFFKERRYLIPYEKMPETLIQAFISAEDDQFFNHPGVNVISMIRAGIANFRAGHVVQGGSTITQQVAKSLLLTPERSFVRKIREVILASRIERHLTKQQILFLYLNQIYLGHGSYGAQAAAKTYFRKDVSELTIAECALLAGLPQAPSKYSPLLNPQKAKERQRYVLRRMAENKYITQTQMMEEAALPIRIHHDEDINVKYAPYWVEHIRRNLVTKFGDKAVYENGLTVSLPTTAELTLAARKSIREGLLAVDKRVGYRGPIGHLKTPDQIEEFLRAQRLKMIERKLGFLLLMPDGRADPFEAVKAAGITRESELLLPDEHYLAVVSSVDDKKKTTGVLIGAVKAEIPFEKMTWARPVRDEKNEKAPRPEPRVPSKVVSKGDIVLIRLISQDEKQTLVSLEQEPQVQGALFSIDARTGIVLAMEGGYDFASSEFNRAIQAQRQPGSSFKPIIYGAALEKGYNPATMIVDSPIVYEDADTGKWKPSNFEEKFYGDTTFRQALIKSRNVPTIKIVQGVGVQYVIDYARRLGMNGQFNQDLSISLGSGSISLIELTKAYALFPRLGRKIEPRFFATITDRDGKILDEQKADNIKLPTVDASHVPMVAAAPVITKKTETPVDAVPSPTPSVVFPTLPTAADPDQVLDPRVAYVMTNLMKEVVTYGTGHAAQGLNRAAAGKTGTTNDYVDAWFMGFTPQIVTGVWVGFDNHRTMGSGETGARAALPIWLSFMQEAVKNYPDEDFQVPSGVVFASIDPISGKLAPANSSSAIREAFIEGTQPTETAEKTGQSPGASGDFFKEDLE